MPRRFRGVISPWVLMTTLGFGAAMIARRKRTIIPSMIGLHRIRSQQQHHQRRQLEWLHFNGLDCWPEILLSSSKMMLAQLWKEVLLTHSTVTVEMPPPRFNKRPRLSMTSQQRKWHLAMAMRRRLCGKHPSATYYLSTSKFYSPLFYIDCVPG